MAKKVDAIVVLVTCKSKSGGAANCYLRWWKSVWPRAEIFWNGAVTSIYRWKGKIERANEHLVILKSTRKAFTALEREVARLHSYDVPEIIALPVILGSQKYLSWISESVGEK